MTYQRVWTGTGVSTFYAHVVNIKYYDCVAATGCPSSALFSGFRAFFDSGLTSIGHMIFRGTKEDNCFDIPDILSTNTTWYPTVGAITSSATPATMADIGTDVPSNSDNFYSVYESFDYRSMSY